LESEAFTGAGATVVARRALECFEERPDGGWVCRADTSITGRGCVVAVKRGQVFKPGCSFAGYDDFPSFLASVSEQESRQRVADH